MNTPACFALIFAVGLTAHADVSFTQVTKSSAGAAAGQTVKTYIKGDRMRVERGDSAFVYDLAARTITVIHNRQKTYSVSRLGAPATAVKNRAGLNAKADIRETGNRKSIDGRDTREAVLTMNVNSGGARLTMEEEAWLASAGPGLRQWQAFQCKLGSMVSLGATTGDASLQKALADLQQRMGELNGVPVQQVLRVKLDQGTTLTPAQGARNGVLLEITTEWSGFTTAAIPVSKFTPRRLTTTWKGSPDLLQNLQAAKRT